MSVRVGEDRWRQWPGIKNDVLKKTERSEVVQMTAITVSMSAVWGFCDRGHVSRDQTVHVYTDGSKLMINLTEDNQIEIYFPIFIWSD